jgi:lambda family phage portal protein
MESARDINRNFAAGAFMVRKHLDYVSSFSFQPRTGDKELDQELENLMRWWSEPSNCDVAGRHSLAGLIRLAESHRVIDGDVFILKLASGHLQGIEGDRIRNQSGIGVTDSELPNAVNLIHGVHVNAGGKPVAYDVYDKDGWGRYTEPRTVRAKYLLHHGYFDSFAQVRGVSPIASAIPMFVDTLEMKEYARLKAKISQMMALSITRQAPTYDDTDGTSPDYDIDFGKGPVLLNLDPGDEANFLESKNPATEFQAFITLSLQIASKALDIPWSFFDEAYTNYSGSRIALLQYIKSTQAKREQNQRLLDSITRWKLAQWSQRGLINAPLESIKWHWIPSGTPWFDPRAEAEADLMLIQNGLRTRREVRQERYGDCWEDVVRELDQEKQLMESLNLLGPGQATQEDVVK